ncbi:MAG: Ig-like domain-containing protein, partial [Vicinamibacterales bacterium]
MRHRAFRSVSVTLLTLLTLHLSLDAQQAPGIFERDNEGQIWQTLPSFGRPAAPCDWADIDPGANDIGHPVFDPDGTIDPTGELEPLRESGAPLQCPGASEPGPNAVDQLYDPRGVAVFDPGPTTPALSATPDLDATRMSRYRVYAADTLNHRIVSWDFFGGDPRAFGTGVNPVGPDGSLNFGPRDAYPEDQLFYPEGVAVDAAGHVLVADQYNGRVSVFREDESHWFVKTLPPDGAFRGHRAMPSQIAVVPGVTIQVPAEACEVVGAPAVAVTTWTPWFVSDDPAYDGTGMSQVLVYDAQFCLVRALGNPASMDWFDPSYGLDAEWPSPRGSFWMPNQVVFDSAGRLFVADSANYKIEIFDAALEPLMMICNPDPANSPHADCAPGPGVIATTDLTGSYGVAIDTRPVIDPVTRTIKAGWQRLVIANHREHEVSMFEVNLDTAEAEFAFRLRSDGGLAGYPRAVATDQAGRYFVVIPGLDKVQMFDVPALAVFDQAWEPAAGGSAASVQPGQDFYVAYSIVVPPLKPTVVSVTPAISWTGPAQPVDGDSNSVAEPVAEALVGPQPPTDLEHARVLRYRFRFRALDSSAAEMVFTVGASGNPQGGDFVTTAVPKTVVVPIVCADCEQDPPVISASPLQPDPRPFYNDTVVYRDGRINLIANDVIAASGEASGISRISYWFAGPEAAVQPGVRAVLVDSGAAAPTAPVDLIGRTLTTGGDALIHLTQSGQHTIHFEAWDGNGNPSGEQTLTFFLDLDVPFAAFTRPPAAGTDVNGRPWWNSSVSLSASRTDNMTQPADVTMTPSTLTFSSEGMDQRIEVTLEDKAGNTSTLQTPLVSIDMTAPLTTVSPGEGAYPAAVTVTLSAVDAASGVRSLTYSLSGAACLVSSPPPACAGDVTIDGSTASVTFSAPGSTLVTYRAVDWATNSEVVRAATYTINQGPVAVDDAASLAEDSSITLTVLDNDQDEDGGTIEIVTIVEAPAHGSAVINGQTIVYTPASNYAGSDSFRYRIRDSQGATAEATVRITVTGEADPPDAFHDQVETPEDVAIDVNVLLNDTNPDGGALTIVSFTQPDGGTVTFGPNATLRYTPHANVNGGDTFTYTIRNDAGDTDGATVFVTVLPRNDGPIATDDAVTTLEDTPVVINALGNDTHPDGASTTLVSVSPSVTAQGAASIVNQAVVFTPAANFFGTVTLTYTVADPDGDTDTAIITIAVTPVNDPPIAADDAATTTSTTPVLIPVLANDSDIDGGALTVASFTPPLSGAVTVSAGVFTYTAANGYVGVDTFTYTVSDGNGGTDVATVTVTVDPAGQSCEADATPLALVRRQAMFNGRTEGSVQVMTAVDVTFNSGSTLTGDLFIVGTPSVRINGTPAAYGGTVDGTGAATPTNHWVTVNSGASVGRIVRRTDAVTMPTVANPPNPTGTRSLALNQPSESPGSFATIRDLTLNSNYGNVVVPEGTYGTFTANSGTSFTLGVAGAETPAVYNFQSLNLNSQSELRMVGPVVITLQNQAAFNGNVGASAHPEWLTLRIANGGLQLNNSISVYGYVEAPNGEVTVNGGTRLVGGLAADKLTVNSNGTLTLQALPADCEPEPTPVTVTVASASKVYGSADPVFTYAVFGADPSVVTGAPSRVTGEAVGTYTIGQGTLTVTGNYTLTVQPGTLTITPAPLTVRADDASRVYGAPNPSFTATLAGFVNGDDEYDLGGTLAFTTPATPASPMGGYAITPSGLTSANYTISYLDGTLMVTRKPVSVEVIPSGGPYDGAPKVAACVITDGLVGTLTYVGTGATTYGPSATAPVNAGT